MLIEEKKGEKEDDGFVIDSEFYIIYLLSYRTPSDLLINIDHPRMLKDDTGQQHQELKSEIFIVEGVN